MTRSRRLSLVLAAGALLVLAAGVWYVRRTTNRTADSTAAHPDESSLAPLSVANEVTSAVPTESATPSSAAPTLRPWALSTDSRVPTPARAIELLRSEPPARDLGDLAVRMGRTSADTPQTPAVPPEHRIGDEARFWVHDIQNSRYFPITATLAHATDESWFWVQRDLAFDAGSLARGAETFTYDVVPKVRRVFGTEWSPGVDGDRRLHVLHHEDIPGVAGYFSSSDQHTTDIEPHSNQREMFYVNLSVYQPGSYDYLALLAHEMQHMIHWYRDSDEPTWMNEGLSELSAAIAGYPTQTGALFVIQPDTPLLEWQPSPGANGAQYAAAFLYVAYLRARFGDEAIRALVAAPENGAAGVEAALAAIGEPRSFDETFLDWIVANLIDDAERSNGRYGYGDMSIERVSPEPLPEAGTGGTVSQYATDYYDATGLVADGRLALSFRGDSTVGLLSPAPEDRGVVWWSGRGDSSDSRLTLTVDLTGATEAALAFDQWYDLETDWDYAYYQVSSDGGRTWQRLTTSRTTDANPNGNNYGAGLTGHSDGWVEEELDLGAYVGASVRVRFEVVTDDAVNLVGMAVDDVRLGAVLQSNPSGVSRLALDDGGDPGRWTAEGWLRVDPALPQRWALQVVVDDGRELTIHRPPVAPDGSAEIDISAIPGDATVAVLVSALTPATRSVAGYRLGPRRMD